MTETDDQYWCTRFLFQRCLACIYLIGFLIALNQYLPLVGEHGLEPLRLLLKLREVKFWDAPSLFWIDGSDRFVMKVIWSGLALSIFALLGLSERLGIWVSVGVWFLLWVLYSSLVNVGGTFYGFGWEMMLLESGFLAIFLGSAKVRTPVIVIWLIRWMLFRLMFGAGMIKIRGDACWRDLTCLTYHYETQPLPNPLSWWFHHTPIWFHKLEVLFNHFVELVVPFFLFTPRQVRYIAGLLTAFFQAILILSGNLSWLNYLTIVLCIACFDDRFLSRFLPVRKPETQADSVPHQCAVVALALLVAVLSLQPAMNLVSEHQAMNLSYDPLHIVNTYGAFGSVTPVRNELIIEGTYDERPSDSSIWREYEFKGKPGDVSRMPSLVSPYLYKIDWQMWFAAMTPQVHDRWFVNFVRKLLEGDKGALSLIERNPFPLYPPKYIRVRRYVYHFTDANDRSGHWWTRKLEGQYMPPLSLPDLNKLVPPEP